MKTKTTYIARDNKEFDTEAECLEWEQVLHFETEAAAWERHTGVSAEGYLEFLALILKTHNLTPK